MDINKSSYLDKHVHIGIYFLVLLSSSIIKYYKYLHYNLCAFVD